MLGPQRMHEMRRQDMQCPRKLQADKYEYHQIVFLCGTEPHRFQTQTPISPKEPGLSGLSPSPWVNRL